MKLRRILVVTLITILTIINMPVNVFAVYTDFPIVLSNIKSRNYGGTPPIYPEPYNTVTLTGKIESGKAMIKFNDLAKLGASLSVNGDTWVAYINGQTIVFTNNSTTISSSTNYTVRNRENGVNYGYSANRTIYADKASTVIGGVRYVRLTAAVLQAGALMLQYVPSSPSSTYVFDFRVNGSNTPFSDNNTYIVGGNWVNGWNNLANSQIAPHFKYSEIWDDYTDTTNPQYNYQMKISSAQLQIAENVRGYYNSNNAINVNSGFRSWLGNRSVGGKWSLSHHMRGRAMDIADSLHALFDSIKLDFRYGSNQDYNISVYHRNQDPTLGLSGAYEIENAANAPNWLHIQSKPEYGELP